MGEPLTDLTGSHSQETRRRVGRPVKTEVAVTPLPTGPVSKKALQKARYRRMRDLNNIASQKCRLKKKDKERKTEAELREAEGKNLYLTEKYEKYVLLINKLKQSCYKNGIPLPEFNNAMS